MTYGLSDSLQFVQTVHWAAIQNVFILNWLCIAQSLVAASRFIQKMLYGLQCFSRFVQISHWAAAQKHSLWMPINKQYVHPKP